MNNDLALAGKTKLKKCLVIEAVFTSLFADFTDFSFICYFSWDGSKRMSMIGFLVSVSGFFIVQNHYFGV